MARRVATDEVGVLVGDDHVGVVELRRPPNNYFDVTLIRALADAYARLDADEECRANSRSIGAILISEAAQCRSICRG